MKIKEKTTVRFLFLYDSYICDNPVFKESLDKFRHFRNYHWGEDRIKVRTEGGRKCSTLDLTSANLSELNCRSIKILFIRDEYELAYNAIATEMSSEERVVFLLTGQPGIGP